MILVKRVFNNKLGSDMRKINTQYTTARQKILIKEAMIHNQEELLGKGWKYTGGGLSMLAYKKEDIVVKMLREAYRNRKTDIYMKAYNKVPSYLKKYFARVYAISKDRVVQKYVETSSDVWTNNLIEKTRRVLNLCHKHNLIGKNDVCIPYSEGYCAHNIGVVNNNPVFYDFGEESFRDINLP